MTSVGENSDLLTSQSTEHGTDGWRGVERADTKLRSACKIHIHVYTYI